MIRPVFHEGELFGFVANVGHLAEIGGKAVGSFAADATEVFQEGLRIPPVKIVKRDVNDMDLWRLIMANHRTPRNTWGDLNAQIGSLRVAERRVLELLDRFGRDFVEQASDELMDYSERWMRAEIEAIPDGVYEFTEHMEDDGVVDQPVQVPRHRDGQGRRADRRLDRHRSAGARADQRDLRRDGRRDLQRRLPPHRPPHPEELGRLPADPHHRAARLGRERRLPGPVGRRQHRDAPEARRHGDRRARARRCPTASPPRRAATACNFLFGGVHPKTGDYYANYHLEGGGWGAKSYDDGNDAIIVKNGNCRNTPVEIFETRYPLRVRRVLADRGLGRRRAHARRARHAPDPARPGGRRGDRATRSSTARRRASAPSGSTAAARAAAARSSSSARATSEFRTFKEVFGTVSPSKFTNIVLTGGDEVRIDSPGGGGYGDAARARARPRRARRLRGLHHGGAGDATSTAGTAPHDAARTAADHRCAHALRRLAAGRSRRGRGARAGRADARARARPCSSTSTSWTTPRRRRAPPTPTASARTR